MMTMQKLIIPPFSLISLLHGHNIHEKNPVENVRFTRSQDKKKSIFGQLLQFYHPCEYFPDYVNEETKL